VSAIGRAFVAVEPSRPVLAAVEEHVRRAAGAEPGDALRWTRPEQWHATLQFFGRVDDVDAMVRVLERAVRDVEPPAVRLGGGGAFPEVARGSVLWLGFTDGAVALAELARAIGSGAAELGFAPDDHRFRPHLTLARRRPAGDVRPLVGALGTDPVGPAWRVGEIVLFASDQRPDGAHDHSVISRIPLGGEGSPIASGASAVPGRRAAPAVRRGGTPPSARPTSA
jgi:2'-5' RNA ligase